MNIEFYRNVCKSADISVVQVRTPGRNRGKWGWVRRFNNGWAHPVTMERSRFTHATEADALKAAHSHYKLRVG